MIAYLDEILLAVPFVVSLLLTVGLWWMTWRAQGARWFWGWLAAGVTVSLAGEAISIVHTMTTGTRLPPLSWVDLLLLARYVCFALALLLYPAAWPRRKLLEMGGVLLLAAVGVWVCVYRTEFVFVQRDWDQVLDAAMYPVLDIALIYVLSARWRERSGEPWRRTLFLLFLSALSRGVANGIQFCVRMAAVGDSSNWITLFWLLSDALMIAALVWFARRRDDRLPADTLSTSIVGQRAEEELDWNSEPER